MRRRRAGITLPATLLLAFAALLSLLSCQIKDGSDSWKIRGHAIFQYPGPIPVPSGSATVLMYVYRTSGSMGIPTQWSGDFSNGELTIPDQDIVLADDGTFYKDKVCWILTTTNHGMYYTDTVYFLPLLRISDKAERVHTMEFRVYEQPPWEP
jgi:hypothetical protein